MDPELIARLSPEHRRRLDWFEEHQGEVSGIPGPLADGLLLVSKPKGIYKPSDLPYALSIRVNLDSPYEDGVQVPTTGGGWLLRYHQEGIDPSDRDRMFTNRGLMQCIADRVPVGVLREQAPAGHRSRYDVLGLATPVCWSDGYFYFESLNPRATPAIDPVNDVLEATASSEWIKRCRRWRSARRCYDARLRVYRQIVARRGQAGSGRHCWRPTGAAALSLASMQPRPWKVPTCAHTEDPTRTLLPTDSCCEPISTRCLISAFWPLTLRPGPSWSQNCSPERNTRLCLAPGWLTRQKRGNGRTKTPWRSSGSASAKLRTTGNA